METHSSFRTFLRGFAAVVVSCLLFGCGGGGGGKTIPPPVSPPVTPPVAPPTNQAPVISSTPTSTALEDVVFSYQIAASDPDSSQVLSYSIISGPTGMVVSATGLISWTPVEGVTSSGNVEVSVADGSALTSLSVSQTFTIQVTPVNDQLQVQTTLNDFSVDNGTAFSQQIDVADVDDSNNGNDITFALANAPTGMTISDTGLIEWTPSVNASNEFDISATITDGGEDNTQAVSYAFSVDVLFYQPISGRAANYFTGAVLDNVDLRLTNGTETIAQGSTDQAGDYSLAVLDRLLTERLTMIAQTSGFADYASTFSANSELLNQFLTILPSDVSQNFDPSAAFVVNFEGVDLVEFPAASLERIDGQAIQGNVTVQVTVIDPSFDIDVMPGDMVTSVNGEMAPIESFGAMDVILKDESGAAVDIQSGQMVTIRIPLGSNSETPPSTSPLYYYDQISGLWVEEGSAELTSLNGESFYEGQVSHFTTWNADRVFETVFINGCVVDTLGMPVSNARVRAKGRTYSGSSSTRSDSQGNFSIPVRMSSTVLLSGSDGNQSRTFSVSVTDDDLNQTTCIELSAATSTVTLSWGENPSDLDTHFFGPSDENGSEFEVYFGDKQVLVENTTIYLDVDDTSSFGPEIVTIPNFPIAGRYQYVVKRFDGTGAILTSPTRVEINLGARTFIFSPTDGNVTDYWHVFDFVVNGSGDIAVEAVNQWISGFNDRVMPPSSDTRLAKPKPSTFKQRLINKKYYSN